MFILVMASRSFSIPSASGSAYLCSRAVVIWALQCTPGWFLKRRLWMARALMTRSRIAALGSPGALLAIWSKFTGWTSTCRSIRSGILGTRYFIQVLEINNNTYPIKRSFFKNIYIFALSFYLYFISILYNTYPCSSFNQLKYFAYLKSE